MESKRAAFRSALLAMSCVTPGAGAAGPQMDAQSPAPQGPQQVEKREYIAENGRNIVITALGNLIRFESPRGFDQVAGGPDDPIDGYVLAYRDPKTGTLRVLHNVYRSQSSSIKAGLPDFVPISFEGPESGTVFSRGELVQASVVVGTQDGLLQIRTTYSWLQGTVRVESVLKAVASRPVRVISFKRQSRYPVDAGGAYGVLEPKFDVLAVEPPSSATKPILGPTESTLGPSVIFLAGFCCRRTCECPPPLPPFDPWAVNTHSSVFQAGPDGASPNALKPTYLFVADSSDPCERQKAGPCSALPLPRIDQDSLVTAGWLVDRMLARSQSIRFLTRTSVF